jgi:opacity protein-like surface antigen
VDVRPWHWLLGRVSYAHSVRTIGATGYDPLGGNATALPQFRKFDEADRTRDRADVLLQVSPLDTLTLAGSFFVQDDNYFNTSYGLQDAKAFGWSADVSWAPVERASFFAGYGHDDYKSKEQSCNVSAAPPTPCNPLDTFFVNPRDILDSVSAGVNLMIIPKRLDLTLGYRFSFGRSKQSVAGEPGGAASGEPAPVPTTENKFHVLNAVTSFYLTPQWTLKLGYQYERYAEKDFTTDGVSPSLANFTTNTAAADVRSIVLGAQHPNYEAHIVAFSVGYKF